jgi:bacillolysin
MNKFIFFAVTCFVLSSTAFTQETGPTIINYARDGQAYKFANLRIAKQRTKTVLDSRVEQIRLQQLDSNERLKSKYYKSAIAFLDKHADLFKIERPAADKFIAYKISPRSSQDVNVHVDQVHKGVPVFGGGYVLSLDGNSNVYNVGGHFLTSITISTIPKINSRKAQDIALENLKSRFDLSAINTSQLYQMLSPVKLYIYNEAFLNPAANLNYTSPENYKLVWHIYANLAQVSEEFLIDAFTGAIIKNVDARFFVGPQIKDCSASCACPLKLAGVATPNPTPMPVPTNQYYGGTDVNKSYNNSELTRIYYRGEFGRDGANGIGGIGDVNETLVKTYWNGCHDDQCGSGNAWFNYTPPLNMTFCAGSIGGDTFGHEYFHAFYASQFSITSLLTTEYESGALNEALADIFGEDFDTYLGSEIFDWMIGTNSNVQHRSFSNPADYFYHDLARDVWLPFPDRYSSDSYYCGTEDSGGAHTNSTVISKAAFLASVGTSWGLPLNRFNGCKIKAIGLYKVTQILFHALIVRSARILSFNEFYDAVNMGCTLLVTRDTAANRYGVTQDDCNAMKAAMEAVEINFPPEGGCHAKKYVTTCAIGFAPGDVNMDGTVDSADYVMLRKLDGYSYTPPSPGLYISADANKDGIVNAADYDIWRSNFGKTMPAD